MRAHVGKCQSRKVWALWAAVVIPWAAPQVQAVEWVRGGANGKEAIWGIRGGLQFAIPPASHGPRGLIRVLYPTLPGGRYDLINFIAVEPIVNGRRGFSELERSRLDKVAGKRLWVEPDGGQGELSREADGVERLRVVVHVEAFENGAHVRLIIEQRGDRPDEMSMTTQAEDDSAAMTHCILTATMGNRARARVLWLGDEAISSLALYPDYKGTGFAEPRSYPLRKLAVARDGDLVVAVTSNEARPADARPFPGSNRWYYGGFPVTQFWKKAKGTWREDLEAVVNGRYVYWMSRQPIPGGIAFENFELREHFYPGQQFTFGITRRTPAELGLRGSESRPAR
jgi:hypothetical protein